MKYHSILLIIGSAIVVLVAVFFLVRLKIFSPTAPMPVLDQSLPVNDNPGLAPVVRSFSHLINTYEDKESGFSLKYPDEMQIYQADKACYMQLTIKGRIAGFLMMVYSPSCPSPFANPTAGSMEDYRKDYVLKKEGGEIRVHIFKTTDIITSSGAKGIKQEYATTWFDEKTGIEDNINPESFSVQYIFYTLDKGFYIVRSENHNSTDIHVDEVNLFLNMEQSIIDSIRLGV